MKHNKKYPVGFFFQSSSECLKKPWVGQSALESILVYQVISDINLQSCSSGLATLKIADYVYIEIGIIRSHKYPTILDAGIYAYYPVGNLLASRLDQQ